MALKLVLENAEIKVDSKMIPYPIHSNFSGGCERATNPMIGAKSTMAHRLAERMSVLSVAVNEGLDAEFEVSTVWKMPWLNQCTVNRNVKRNTNILYETLN